MTMTERSTVVCVIDSRAKAEQAVDALRTAGFREDQVGFTMRDEGGVAGSGTESKAAEGATGGALTGAAVGGVVGAIAAGLIPGIGPVIAAGILAATIGGAAAGAAAGGLIGGLIGLGVPEEDARYYDQEFRSGRAIVTVKAEGRYQDAVGVLSRYGSCERPTSQTPGSLINETR